MSGEIYISVDVEADGPCPGLFSMLSLGAVAFDPSRPEGDREIGAFSVNLELLEGAAQDHNTMEFWRNNQAAYDITRQNCVHPAEGMAKFSAWLKSIPGKKICAAYPAGFDFTFLYYYSHRFLRECLLGFSALDMKTYAMCLRNTKYVEATKKNFPKAWFEGSGPHTHVAVEDAREQGQMFMHMLKARTAMESDERALKNRLVDMIIAFLEELKS
jgi:hypothetical protein